MLRRSVDRFRYFGVFADHSSRCNHIALLEKRFDVCKSLTDLIDNGHITTFTIRADQGSEYLRKLLQCICTENNIR